MLHGRIKAFDTERGFGFIRQDVGPDLFFHVTQWLGEYAEPNLGDRVTYDIGKSNNSKHQNRSIGVRVTPVAEQVEQANKNQNAPVA